MRAATDRHDSHDAPGYSDIGPERQPGTFGITKEETGGDRSAVAVEVEEPSVAPDALPGGYLPITLATLYQFDGDIPGKSPSKMAVNDRKMQKLVTVDRKMPAHASHKRRKLAAPPPRKAQ